LLDKIIDKNPNASLKVLEKIKGEKSDYSVMEHNSASIKIKGMSFYNRLVDHKGKQPKETKPPSSKKQKPQNKTDAKHP
jgi:hypothetical protein